MKKKIFLLLLLNNVVFSFPGGGRKITLKLPDGDTIGTYSGEMSNDVPNGQGRFTAKNDAGEIWTYEGEFKNGHFDGKGKITRKNGQCEVGTYKNDAIVPLKNAANNLFLSPETLIYNCVEITGKICSLPEYTDSGVIIQMNTDLVNNNKTVAVYINNKNFKATQNNYLTVTGIVCDKDTALSLFNKDLSIPAIIAKKHRILNYIDAVSPTKKDLIVNHTQTQLGYSVTVQKVEIAEAETRVYVKVENNGLDRFSLYSLSSKIIQNGKEYEENDNIELEYPDVQLELIKGISTSGIIVFPPISESDFTLILHGSSYEINETIAPYKFNISF